jgi:hypothetical protein
MMPIVSASTWRDMGSTGRKSTREPEHSDSRIGLLIPEELV